MWCQNRCRTTMKTSAFPIVLLSLLTFASKASAQEPCRYLKSRSGLAGYETGCSDPPGRIRGTNEPTELRRLISDHYQNHSKPDTLAGAPPVGVETFGP